ncbi:formin-binding protein 1-like isoform X2 [Liolophura sinensis]|uniref:formin-binding protein 1-like isoform X2 n=1 Tax=Liolophura sinensis TaxID=3198878 RepID=UPI003159195A
MSWGTELWDQYDNLEKHTQKGIDFCEKVTHFYKERCAIENEYASKLKKLVKNYQPKKKEEDDYVFTCTKGFLDMLKELHDSAGQHEVIAENIQSNIIKDLSNLIQELKQERKKHLQDCVRLQQQMRNSVELLDRSKRKYEKAFGDAERAKDAYKRADDDINLSRAEVEKHKNISLNKTQHCDECKNEYAAQLMQTNNTQKEHYTVSMPQAFQQLQDMDERRIVRIGEFIKATAEIERNVVPIINTCIDGVLKAGEAVDPAQDSKIVIDKYKSGFQIPTDIPFEDLRSGGSSQDLHRENSTPSRQFNHSSAGKGTTTNKSKKRTGIFGLFSVSKKEDFSDLPPNQRKKRLLGKIESINRDITRETAEREGLLKMKQVYNDNNALGDPASLDKKIEENAVKLDSLQQEMRKFEAYLADAEGRGDAQKRHSFSDDSMSHSTSDGSVKGRSSAPGTPNTQSHYEHIKEGGDAVDKGSSHPEIQYVDHDSFEEVDDQFPVIGTARALYSFEPTTDSSVHIDEFEDVLVIETDQGDGWTRVRKANDDEGFVPTSYIEIHLYDQDQV